MIIKEVSVIQRDSLADSYLVVDNGTMEPL